jgi:NADPH:quinone reductase-like Zn-dependent oxidoreductase
MKTLSVNTHAKDAAGIKLILAEREKPNLNKNECLIKVISSGVNPSDVLAVMGYFKHAVLPRIPGRDFSGIVIEGPSNLVGKQVWGTGGAAGISFDGVQAEYIKLSVAEISESPSTLDPIIAGAQPLPYITAYYSLVKRAHIVANETILVVGALGQVGSAAMSVCRWKKCNSIALVRGIKEVAKASSQGWNAINSEDNNLSEKILEANNGRPVQVILNSVGNIYWQDFINVLAEFGRIVIISARENVREANINLFNLYRANQDIIGVNTVSLDFNANAKLLNELKIGFEENKLTPLAVEQSMIYTPEQASQAYREVIQGSSGKRVVIKFI